MLGNDRKLSGAIAASALSALVVLSGCQAAPAPTAGGAPAAGKPAPTPAQAAQSNEAKPTPAPPSKPDGIYTPNTYREIYQQIATDYQEIAALTNQVNEGKPLPKAEILKIYEEAKNAKVGTGARPMRNFAKDPARAQEFPEAAEFYGSPTFLDDRVMDAINGTGSAAGYTPAQQRQAIQKGLQRVLYHWSRHYVARGAKDLNPGLVDEGWAIYMGKETADGKYPNSLSATAVSREQNFNRAGSIDVPLRQALSQLQKAAGEKNAAAAQASEKEVYSRLNAIFYLASARYMNEALKTVQAGNPNNAGPQMVEGLSFYQSIQPTVARADAAADKTVTAYYTAQPASLTVQMRDDALVALNRGFEALLLKPADRVTPAAFN